MREPCEGKLSSTVLRREGIRKDSDLSDTVGTVTEETIKEYIENQTKNNITDVFKIED